jgi:hypothetical protein
MNKIKTIGVVTLLLLLLLPSFAGASSVAATIDTKYEGYNQNWNALDMNVNITTTEAVKLVYLENYYAIDSYGNPKFDNSKRYFDGNITPPGVFLQTLRPIDRHGGAYTFIEIVMILNGNRTLQWYDLRDYWK